MQTFAKWLDRLLIGCACLFTVGYIISVLIQVFSRTFLPFTPAWTEEGARYFFIYAVATAAGPAARANSYVAVDIVTMFIPKRYKKASQIGIDAILIAFSTFFLIKCVPRFAFMKRRLVSTAMEIPMQWIYFALVILFASLIINYLLDIILMLTGEQPAEAPLQ
ncbi:MAG: TRAP transporter small permease subunit [Planctomycetes bacterium]|nr:TRAP transporter small permease subunit [Planctomycetota bacterium]